MQTADFDQVVGFSPDGQSLVYGSQCVWSPAAMRTFCALQRMPSTPSLSGHNTLRFVADTVLDGDVFTADSANVVFAVASDPGAPEAVHAVPVTGGATIALSGAAWVDTPATKVRGWQGWRRAYAAIGGSRMLVAEAQPPLDHPPSTSLRIVDATGAAPATTLASDVDPQGFFLSADGASVAYVSLSERPGLHVVATT